MITGQVTPALALAAYAEAWVTGAKVVVFGNALSSLAERLVDRGARLVYVYDADPVRVSEATALGALSQVSYAPLSQAGAAMRDGVFDVGIIEDISLSEEAASSLVGRLRRALSSRGRAIVATRNSQAQRTLLPREGEAAQEVGYYELYDAVSAEFDEVRMFGQTPFVGYAVADFGASEDPEVQVDTAFLSEGAEDPEWFFAQASQLPEEAGPFCVIQLPLAEISEAGGDRASIPPPPPADANADNGSQQIEELQRELDQREEWLVGVESRASAADERADAMQADLDRLTEDGETKKRILVRVRKELDEALAREEQNRKEAQSVETNAESRRRLLDEHQRNTAHLQSNAAQLELRANQLKGDVTELQSTVSELEATIAQLEATISQLEREQGQGTKKAAQQLSNTERKLSDAERNAVNAERNAVNAERNAANTERKLADAQTKLAEAQSKVADAQSEGQAKLEQVELRARHSEEQLAEAKIRDSNASSQLRSANSRLKDATSKLDDAEQRFGAVEKRLADSEKNLAAEKARSEQAGKQRQQFEDTSRRAAEAQSTQHQNEHHRADKLEQQLRVSGEQLRAREEQLRTGGKELASLKLKMTEQAAASEAVAAKKSQVDGEQDQSARLELKQVELHLRERGQAVLKLQRELESTERLGRELLVELEELRESPEQEVNDDNGSELRKSNARLTADLEAARWTIEALEGRLNGANPAE